MEAFVIGTTLATSFATAFWLQKAALSAFFRAIEEKRTRNGV